MRVCLMTVAVAVFNAGSAFAEEDQVAVAYRQMYNLDFEGAHRTLAEWQQTHPEDPMGPASDAAAFLYSEFDRLHILQSEFFASDSGFFHMHKPAPDPAV